MSAPRQVRMNASSYVITQLEATTVPVMMASNYQIQLTAKTSMSASMVHIIVMEMQLVPMPLEALHVYVTVDSQGMV